MNAGYISIEVESDNSYHEGYFNRMKKEGVISPNEYAPVTATIDILKNLIKKEIKKASRIDADIFFYDTNNYNKDEKHCFWINKNSEGKIEYRLQHKLEGGKLNTLVVPEFTWYLNMAILVQKIIDMKIQHNKEMENSK
jgi:hypothetical protein